MNKNKILFVFTVLLASLLSLNLASAYIPYYYGYDTNDNSDNMHYPGHNPYFYDDYIEGKSFSYVDYQGYEHGPKYVDNLWSFSTLKSTGFTEDGGYKTTRTFTTTSVDYPNYFDYGYSSRMNYYGYNPRQQYYFYY